MVGEILEKVRGVKKYSTLPDDRRCDGKTLSSLTFCIGFIVMIILDVSLG